jgi:hypothetical protein
VEQKPVPEINDSEFQDILNEVRALVPFYTPEWTSSGEKSAGTALLKLFAHMMETSIHRLNKVPEKNFIAFLDMLGIKLVPAQPARVPLTFILSKGASENVLIPERTQAASGEIMFETGTNILATPAKFISAYNANINRDGIYQAQSHIVSGEVVSTFTTKLTYGANSGDKNLFLDDVSGLEEGDILEIGGDGTAISRIQVPEYVMIAEVADTMVSLADRLSHNHDAGETVSKAVIFELFEGRNIQEHVLYLGHEDLFNIKPAENEKSSLSLNFTIHGVAEQKPALEWSYWGENTQTETEEWLTAESTDNTSDFAQSGVVTLSIASEIKETEVDGIKSMWLRARVKDSLLKKGKLPVINTVSVGIENTLSPDMAFHNDIPIDLTLGDDGNFKEDLYPFGKKPRFLDTFYLGSKEAFSKKGATITLSFNVSGGSGGSGIPVENIHGIGPTFTKLLKSAGINTVDQLLQYSDTDLMRILHTNMRNRALNILSAARKAFVEASRLGSKAQTASKAASAQGSSNDDELALSWEYWNGKGWVVLKDVIDDTECLLSDGTATFVCPSDIEATQVSGQENYWIRVRIASGDYGEEMTYDTGLDQWVPGTISPPSFYKLTVTYSLQPKYLEHCLTCNNLEYINVTEESKTPGKTFQPFQTLDDEHHTLYLGFDKKIESGPISIFFAIEEPQYKEETPPRIVWEYFARGEEGGEWVRLQVLDETEALSQSGTIEFVVPDDFTSCSLYGQALYWIRAVDADDRFQSPASIYTDVFYAVKSAYASRQAYLKYESPVAGPRYFSSVPGRFDIAIDSARESRQEEVLEPCPPSHLVAFHPLWAAPAATPEYSPNPRIEGIYLNTTWALQMEAMKDEIMGSSDGEREQVFTLTKVPVTAEEIWVNEFNSLSEDEMKEIIDDGELEVEEVQDDKGNTTGFWIMWTEVDDLLGSEKDDRHYEIDRISGTIKFGDGTHGGIPPIGTDNIKADYWFGGGKTGNVSDSTVTSLKTSVPFVDKVSNPLDAAGGSETETIDKVLERGPQLIRHRNRAVTREDFEWLAKQASPSIARAKCLPNFDNTGEHKAGWVTVIIVPESEEKQPRPTLELRSRVEDYLKDQTANTVVSPERLQISEPVYVEVSVETTIVTTSIDAVPVIESEALYQLEEFLHPLTGGFEGEGWDFGKAPCLSDFFNLLENIPDVDHVDKLEVKVKSGEKQTLSELAISPDDPGEIEMPPYTLVYSGEHEIKVTYEKEV